VSARWERVTANEWVMVDGADALATVERARDTRNLWRCTVLADNCRVTALCDRPGRDAAMQMVGEAMAGAGMVAAPPERPPFRSGPRCARCGEPRSPSGGGRTRWLCNACAPGAAA